MSKKSKGRLKELPNVEGNESMVKPLLDSLWLIRSRKIVRELLHGDVEEAKKRVRKLEEAEEIAATSARDAKMFPETYTGSRYIN